MFQQEDVMEKKDVITDANSMEYEHERPKREMSLAEIIISAEKVYTVLCALIVYKSTKKHYCADCDSNCESKCMIEPAKEFISKLYGDKDMIRRIFGTFVAVVPCCEKIIENLETLETKYLLLPCGREIILKMCLDYVQDRNVFDERFHVDAEIIVKMVDPFV